MQTTRRLPLPLILAAAMTACAVPGAVTLDQKVEKVEQMTRALSLSQNAGIKAATESMTSLGQTMNQGGFQAVTGQATGLVSIGGGNIVGAGAGNLVSIGGGNVRYVLASLVPALREDVYRLLAQTRADDGSVYTFDDATGELTGVSNAVAAMTVGYQVAGDTRTYTLGVTKSPDGTTGTVTLKVTASGWVAAQPPAGGYDDGGYDDGGYDDGYDDGYGDYDDDDYDGYALKQAAGAKIFGNEQPAPGSVTAMAIGMDVLVKGNAQQRVKLDAVLDGVTLQPAVAAHLGFNLEVPTLALTTDTRLAGTELSSKGGLKVQTEAALESFSYDLGVKTGGAGSFNLVHEGARVRFAMAMQPTASGVPAYTYALYDADKGDKLADVEPAGAQLRIAFTNGKTVLWDPVGGQGLTLGGSPAPTGGAPSVPSASTTPSPGIPAGVPTPQRPSMGGF